MLYTPLTIRAIKIAFEAHKEQYDKGGVPYIFHPFHLAEQMTDECSVCAALLHDTVEDTDVTIEQLEELFPSEVTEAVKLLTHDKNVGYFDYILKIKTNETARKVKLADLAHNSDTARRTASGMAITEKDKLRFEKYRRAAEMLRT